MKANKQIWYGNVPPKNSDGTYQKDAVFDRRVKRIAIGDDVSKLVTDEGVKQRMIDSGHIAKEVPEERVLRGKEEVESLDERVTPMISGQNRQEDNQKAEDEQPKGNKDVRGGQSQGNQQQGNQSQGSGK